MSFSCNLTRFVNLMEGHIWIESEGLGKGCTASFIVKLGCPERSNESKLPLVSMVQANHSQTNFTGLKVLVMDENGSVTFFFCTTMHFTFIQYTLFVLLFSWVRIIPGSTYI